MMMMMILFAAVALIACFLAGWAVRLHQQLHRSALAQAEAHAAAERVARGVQLLAHELHGLSLGLRGHVDRLSQVRYSGVGGLAALVAQLDDLSGELGAHLAQNGKQREVACESVPLGPLVAEAAAAVEASIAPGRRYIRISDDSPPLLTLWADRRALRLVLARVLGEAVRSSAQDDWIEIGWTLTPSNVVLTVADEGHGRLTSGAGQIGADSRGIGLRLALARLLVEAHGGRLEIEAREKVGALVSVYLPRDMALNPDVLEFPQVEKSASATASVPADPGMGPQRFGGGVVALRS
jgi:signal transduction histidine kinase